VPIIRADKLTPYSNTNPARLGMGKFRKLLDQSPCCFGLIATGVESLMGSLLGLCAAAMDEEVISNPVSHSFAQFRK
jgi:hypothetical protein